MKKEGRYQKILNRKDRRRPSFVKELSDDKFISPDALILSVKVLMPNNTTMKIDWSEKVADEMEARKNALKVML